MDHPPGTTSTGTATNWRSNVAATAAAAVGAEPVEIGFDAEHGRPGLPVVTELAANRAAGRAELS